jgi:hypothetical protein
MPAALKDFLEGQVEASVATIVELRDDPSQKGTVRLAAATALLDRVFGRPAQAIAVVPNEPRETEITEQERLREIIREAAQAAYASESRIKILRVDGEEIMHPRFSPKEDLEPLKLAPHHEPGDFRIGCLISPTPPQDDST